MRGHFSLLSFIMSVISSDMNSHLVMCDDCNRKWHETHLTLVWRCTYKLWKLLVFSICPKFGPWSLCMISAFMTRAMWAGSRDSNSRSWSTTHITAGCYLTRYDLQYVQQTLEFILHKTQHSFWNRKTERNFKDVHWCMIYAWIPNPVIWILKDQFCHKCKFCHH